MSRVGIIDLDPLPYQIGFAFGEASFPGEVTERIERDLRKLWKGLRTDNCEYYLSDSSSNFRLDIANIRQYKGGRNSVKPYYFDYTRDYLQERLGDDCHMVYGCEADDIVADRTRFHGQNAILASIDKDLWTVPGYHYNPGWGNATEKKIHWVTEEEALKFHHVQVLTGDTTDGITGCYNVGPTKAKKLIEACETQEEMLEAVKGMYRKVYGEEPIKFQDWKRRWIYMDWEQIFKENEQLIYMGMDNRPEFNYEDNYGLA